MVPVIITLKIINLTFSVIHVIISLLMSSNTRGIYTIGGIGYLYDIGIPPIYPLVNTRITCVISYMELRDVI